MSISFEYLAAYTLAEDRVVDITDLVRSVNNLRHRRKLFHVVIARYTERIWQATWAVYHPRKYDSGYHTSRGDL